MKKILLVLSLLTLGACTSVSNFSKNKIKNEIIMINQKDLIGKEFTINDRNFDSKITLGFTKDRIYGFSAVNRYFGLYKIIDNKLIVNTLGNTLVLGEEKLMFEELKYLALLQDNKKIELKDNYLTLISNEGITIRFKDIKSPKLEIELKK